MVNFSVNSWLYAAPIFYSSILLLTDYKLFEIWKNLCCGICIFTFKKLTNKGSDKKAKEDEEREKIYARFPNKNDKIEQLLPEGDPYGDDMLDANGQPRETFAQFVDPTIATKQKKFEEIEYLLRRDFIACVMFGICQSVFLSKTEKVSMLVGNKMVEVFPISKANFKEKKKNHLFKFAFFFFEFLNFLIKLILFFLIKSNNKT